MTKDGALSQDATDDHVTISYLVVDTTYWQNVQEATSNLSSPDNKNLPSIGSSYARALKALGMQAEFYCANLPPSPLLKVVRSRRKTFKAIYWRYWQLISRIPLIGPMVYSNGPFGRALRQAIEKSNADVLIVCNINLMLPHLVNKLRKSPSYWIGLHASQVPRKKWLKHYSHMFSALPSLVLHFRELGLKSTYLPLAFDSTAKGLNTRPLEKRNIDVSFVGSLNRHFLGSVPLFRSVARVSDLHIESHSHPLKFLLSGLYKNYRGRNQSVLDTYSDSKLVINRHVKLAKGFSANLRMFEATASGAVLLTEESENINDLFEDGREVVTYRDDLDASIKVCELLDNLDSAQNIASAGQIRLLREHSYEKRAIELHRRVRALLDKGV